MKNQLKHFLLAMVILLSTSASVQAQNAAKILKSYKGETETMMINVPGFIAKWTANMQGVGKEYKEAIKKVKNLIVFIAEESDPKIHANMMKDFNRLFKKRAYKPLMQVKSDGSQVNFQFLPATKRSKGELVILVDDEDDFVALVIEGNFTENDVQQLAKNINVNEFRH